MGIRTISLALVCAVLSAGCQSPSGVDLTVLCPPTEYRADAAPLDPVFVALGSDRRPLEESGSRDILGRSYVDATLLLEPPDAAFLRLVARDLTVSGVSEQAAINTPDHPLVLSVDLLRGGASYAEGPETLLLVVPTSTLEARWKVRFTFGDRLGRTFLEKEYEATRKGAASLVGGPERQSLELLAETMREVIDRALPELHAAPAAFFARFGTPPPARSEPGR